MAKKQFPHEMTFTQPGGLGLTLRLVGSIEYYGNTSLLDVFDRYCPNLDFAYYNGMDILPILRERGCEDLEEAFLRDGARSHEALTEQTYAA